MSNESDPGSSTIARVPPKHSLSDYFVLILLSICIAVGTPMTLMICWRLMQRLRLTGVFGCARSKTGQTALTDGSRRGKSGRPLVAQSQVSSSSNLANSRRTDLLKLQLNVADLMVLIFYAFSKVIWTLTYNWRGGEVLCKIVRFLSVLSFHMCSNSVVCIGLDRMITLLRPNSSRACCRWKGSCAREYLMVAISCTSAVLCSLPQLWIWTVREIFPNWCQCVTVLSNKKQQTADDDDDGGFFGAYMVFHLLTIFWIPCAIIAFSYIVIVFQVLLHLKEPSGSTNAAAAATTSGSDPRHLRDEDEQGVGGGGRGLSTPATPSAPQGRLVLFRRIKVGKGLLRCGRLTRFLCRQTLTILTAYIVCWLPYNALTLWIYFRPEHGLIYSTMLKFLQETVVLNSVINPFLYACDVYHQIVDERTRQDPHTCLCCFFSCPCALVEDSEAESAGEDL